MSDRYLEVNGRSARVLWWIADDRAVILDPDGLALMAEGAGRHEGWRLADGSAALRQGLADASPAEILLASYETLASEASRLHQLNREADKYLAERVRLGKNPGGRRYPPKYLAAEVEQMAEAKLDRYMREWVPGQRVAPGCMECDGLRPDGGEGPHLRLAHETRSEMTGWLGPGVSRWEPELRPGEVVIRTIGSDVPIIVRVPRA